MIDLVGETLLEISVKYEKNSCRSFLVPKMLKRPFFWNKACRKHFERWLEDAMESFVKFEK